MEEARPMMITVQRVWCWKCNRATEHETRRPLSNIHGSWMVTECRGCGEKELERL